jgi:hypothetical protein
VEFLEDKATSRDSAIVPLMRRLLAIIASLHFIFIHIVSALYGDSLLAYLLTNSLAYANVKMYRVCKWRA